ncbi:hypothetical protein AOLI_G00064130 [Acnodon oligacanthus]
MQSVGEQSRMLRHEGCGLRVCYWLTLVTGLVECLCFAGAVFGWASLVFVLKSDGYFTYLCVNQTVNGTITEALHYSGKQTGRRESVQSIRHRC